MAEVVLRGRRASFASKAMCLLVANYLLIAFATTHSSRSPAGALIAATAFWGLLAAFPRGLNRTVVFSPRNYITFLFFFSMVVGPIVMMFGQLVPRLWILHSATWDTDRAWDYMPAAALLWGIALFAYLLTVGRPPPAPSGGRDLEREAPAAWMLVTGLGLIGAGIIGLSLATGSLADAVSLGGRRAASQSALLAGSYRYTGWMEGVPLGAALVWYFVTQRMRMGRFGAFVWAIVLYLPLFPFYLYTAGRARALIPLLLLLALYHRFVHPFGARWLVAGLVVLIPTMSLWAIYRAGLDDVSLRNDRVNTVLAADFSRFEVTTTAIAGFEESGMSFYRGSTLRAASTHWLPALRRSGGVDGTAATAQALAGNRSWNLPSSYATSLVAESYLNFGLAGVVLAFAALGRAVAWLDRKASSSNVLAKLLALSVVLKLPFAVSAAISVSQIIWAVAFPFVVAWLVRSVLRRSRGSRSRHPGRVAARPQPSRLAAVRP
jgi:hypothetical protein